MTHHRGGGPGKVSDMERRLKVLAIIIGCIGGACGDFPPYREDAVVLLDGRTITVTPVVELDPYRWAKLTAIIRVRHPALPPDRVDRMRITIEGQGGSEDLSVALVPASEAFWTHFDMRDRLAEGEVGIPVLGLYAGAVNRVRFELESGPRVFAGEAQIETEPVAFLDRETAVVEVLKEDEMEPGWTWFNGRVYDPQGHLRWLGGKIYRHLENGNILTGIDERNWLGRVITDRTLPSYLTFHHDAIQLPNGNVVACVSNARTEVVTIDGETVESTEDYVVEMDHATGEIVNAWDLRPLLDVDRKTWVNLDHDWFHANTLAYDADDDAILVSGRFQGIVKLARGGIRGESADRDDALVWLLAPHLDWGLAGWDGEGTLDPNDYLLTAVDADGAPYPREVQLNLEAPEPEPGDFYWPLGQHGLEITAREEGRLSLLVFNNQASFLMDGEGTTNNGVFLHAHGRLKNDRSSEPYSQIIEYEIDEAAMTVRRLWSFGEERPELYGSKESGVAYLRVTGNRLMLSNGGDQTAFDDNPYNPNIVEVTEAGDVVFHLQIRDAALSVYHGGRVDLYHPER